MYVHKVLWYIKTIKYICLIHHCLTFKWISLNFYFDHWTTSKLSLLSNIVAVGSLQKEVVRLSTLIGPFLPTTHTQHTHTCGFLSVWTLCSPSVWFDLIFPLSHLISIPPSLSVRTGKKQGPPENRNKGNPSIHPSVPLCPSIFPVTHPLLTLHLAAGGECPVHLSLSLLYKGDVLSPCFTCKRVQLSTFRSLTANNSVHNCHTHYRMVTVELYLCLKLWERAQKRVCATTWIIFCREFITQRPIYHF